ncbi:MAG: hypothetical protein IJK06_12830 [Clostridia bacterium]|nr:hypothetical protein [Clostridia bacterium]MBR0515121.1 hypothetical protein [Clostridia bacterium]
MKKIILLVMAMILLVSSALAEDLPNMTDEELLILYQQVSGELANRNLAPNELDEPLKNRLFEFMSLWYKQDIAGMVHYSTSDWLAKQENPQLSMSEILKGRQPIQYELISVSGDPWDSVRFADCDITINWNTGKPYKKYNFKITMVLEEDGLWHVDPTSLVTNELPEGTLMPPELTPAPEEAQDESLKMRLYEFMCLWSENDIAGMVKYCSSEWAAQQEDPAMSLFGILKNRTPIVYELVSVSGSPADTTRSVACNVEADLHTGKDYKTYEYQISMVLENGLWYVDPASIVANYTSEPTLVPELTPAPDGAAAGTAGDIIDAEVKNRLNEFILFWSANDCPSMVNYCTSDWKSKQENPQASLLAVLKNRTAVTYKLNALLKAPDNKSCTASCNIEIDSNIGKPHRIYLYMISMVLEDDGLWYVDPASLATNEIPESAPVPEQTPAPAAEITGDTILYYNPEGGSKYHLDPNCKTVNPKFIPLQGTFRYSEVNDPQYQELRTCHICLAPERPSGDSGELSPSDYTQKAWAFTAELYAEILKNPESNTNQPFCVKGMVQEVVSENPLTVVINTGDDGESLPVIIESPDADKIHWEKGCKYRIYGDFVSVKDNMPVLNARFSFTW